MRRTIVILAVFALLALPATSLAGPYLTLRAAWTATKGEAERLYHHEVTFGVGNVISPRMDCRRHSALLVDCGFAEITWSGGATGPGPAATAPPYRGKLCEGTARVRITRAYKIMTRPLGRPSCRVVRPEG
jgi:hypothetical protein